MATMRRGSGGLPEFVWGRLLEETQDLVFRYRFLPDPGFEYVSPSAYPLTGYTPEEFLADPDLGRKMVLPEDRERLETVLTAGDAEPVVLRFRRKDGATAVFEQASVVERDADDVPVAVSGIARDVTARARADEERDRLLAAMESERAWLRTVIDHSTVGIVLVEGRDGRRMIVNRRIAELAGEPLAQVLSTERFLHRVLSPGGTPLTPEQHGFGRVLAGATIVDEERLLVRADGTRIPAALSAAPIRGAHGEVTGAVLIYRDLTAEKQLERHREEWNSVIAHDPRQPVAVIALNGGLLQRRAADDETRQRARHVVESARHLGRMIGDLLDSSRLETRRLELWREPTDLAGRARKAIDRLAAALTGAEVRLEVRGDCDRLPLDATRIEQVLFNLLSNAAKYGAPGAPIAVAVERGAGEVEVAVSNTGPGIPADELPLAFDRFHRCRSSVASRKEGLGLGLYIARGIVEAHGDRIEAASEPGGTTVFRFTLPIEADDEGAARASA